MSGASGNNPRNDKSLNKKPNSSKNVQNNNSSFPWKLSKKLKSALKGRTFVIVDKYENAREVNFEHDVDTFLEMTNNTVMQHDFEKQAWLKANVQKWKYLIDDLQYNFFCAIFTEDDFSKTYVFTKEADFEPVDSKISKFFDRCLSNIKISPHVMEFVKRNKTFSDLKLKEIAQDEIWIQNISNTRLAKLKKEMRKVSCQGYLLDDKQYDWLSDEENKVLSCTEQQFQVKGKTFTTVHDFVIEVNHLTHISVVSNEFPSLAVDSLIILSNQEPSQEYDLVFDGHDYKVWQTVPWDIPANQVVYAEITPSFTERKLSSLFEKCLNIIYDSSHLVTVLGIQPCSQSIQNWKSIFSCLVSAVEHLRAEQVKIPKHYIMLITEKKKNLAEIKTVFENKKTFAGAVKGKLNLTVIDGDLSAQKVDVIVNSSNLDLNLEYGELSKALLKKAGQGLQWECNREKSKAGPDSLCLITKGYDLPCPYVLHGILPSKYQKSAVTNLVYACLETASKYDLSSIAFPTLGIGNLKYPIDDVVKEMHEGINNFLTEYSTNSIKEIRIVVFPGQPNIKQKFSQLMTAFDIPSSPSFTSEEKWLQNYQKKWLHWILFVNYSNISENMERGLRNFQTDFKKLPFNLHSEDLENLLFFGDISSLVPDIATQYSGKKDEEIQLLVPRENFTKLKDMLTDIKNKIISENLKLKVKHKNKQIEKVLQEIQQENPQVRCQFSDQGQIFIFHSFDSDLNQEAKDQLMSFLDYKDNISFTQDQSSRNEHASSSSYFKQENLRDEAVTVSPSFMKPEKTPRHMGSFRMEYRDELSREGSQLAAGGFARNEAITQSTQNIPNICCFQVGDSLLVKVYEGDILNVEVDGIVNAANKWLAHAGGVARAIINAAGDAVNIEGQNKRNGKALNDGEVLSTSAGKLTRYRNIIHAVGPMSTSSNGNCQKKIEETVYNSLTEANKLGLRSVALPAISSGIFGVPLDICTNGYVMGVKEFYRRKPSDRQLKEVHFVDMNSVTCKAIKDNFAKELKEVSEVIGNNIHRSRDISANIPSSGKDEETEVEAVDKKNLRCLACKKPVGQMMCQKYCKHIFCIYCIEKPCFICNPSFEITQGNHPPGIMSVKEDSFCYCEELNIESVYEIEYKIDSSHQQDQLIQGFNTLAYLPDTEEGTTILKMLQLAFERYLIFRVERNNAIVSWADIPHKTNVYNTKGMTACWDPNYLRQVKARLAAKRITPEDVAERDVKNLIDLNE